MSKKALAFSFRQPTAPNRLRSGAAFPETSCCEAGIASVSTPRCPAKPVLEASTFEFLAERIGADHAALSSVVEPAQCHVGPPDGNRQARLQVLWKPCGYEVVNCRDPWALQYRRAAKPSGPSVAICSACGWKAAIRRAMNPVGKYSRLGSQGMLDTGLCETRSASPFALRDQSGPGMRRFAPTWLPRRWSGETTHR